MSPMWFYKGYGDSYHYPISLPKDFTWRSNERMTGSPTGQRHYWRCLPNGRTAYRMESRITLPEAYQMTTEKSTDILPKLPTEMAAEKLTKKSTKSTKIH